MGILPILLVGPLIAKVCLLRINMIIKSVFLKLLDLFSVPTSQRHLVRKNLASFKDFTRKIYVTEGSGVSEQDYYRTPVFGRAYFVNGKRATLGK